MTKNRTKKDSPFLNRLRDIIRTKQYSIRTEKVNFSPILRSNASYRQCVTCAKKIFRMVLVPNSVSDCVHCPDTGGGTLAVKHPPSGETRE